MEVLWLEGTGPTLEDALRNLDRAGRADSRHTTDESLYSVSATVQACFNGYVSSIKDVVRKCATDGWENCREAVEELECAIERGKEALGVKGDEFVRYFGERLHDVARTYVDGLMNLIPLTTTVSGKEFELSSVEMSYKLVVGGSIGASLSALCEFVGQGQLVVSGAYSPVSSGAR